jgi:hypothetical protein
MLELVDDSEGKGKLCRISQNLINSPFTDDTNNNFPEGISRGLCDRNSVERELLNQLLLSQSAKW